MHLRSLPGRSVSSDSMKILPPTTAQTDRKSALPRTLPSRTFWKTKHSEGRPPTTKTKVRWYPWQFRPPQNTALIYERYTAWAVQKRCWSLRHTICWICPDSANKWCAAAYSKAADARHPSDSSTHSQNWTALMHHSPQHFADTSVPQEYKFVLPQSASWYFPRYSIMYSSKFHRHAYSLCSWQSAPSQSQTECTW